MITLKKWQHPTTWEIRVYANWNFSSRWIKAYIYLDSKKFDTPKPMVKVSADYSINLEEVENEIYSEVFDEKKLDTWEKILNAAQ